LPNYQRSSILQVRWLLQAKFSLPGAGGEERFRYEGSVVTGTTIHYGEDFRWTATIHSSAYTRLLKHFSGKEVQVGTSKDNPPAGSVGEWVKANINRSGLMSYIGAILVEEGYATQPKRGWIRFSKSAGCGTSEISSS
jgi:hypothetical protein